jgi:hypothetical protein
MSTLAILSYTTNDLPRVQEKVDNLIYDALGSLSERDVNSIESSVVLIDRKMTSLRQHAHVGNFVAGLVQPLNPDLNKQVLSVCLCIQKVYEMIGQHRIGLAAATASACGSSASGLQRCTSFDEQVQYTLMNCY